MTVRRWYDGAKRGPLTSDEMGRIEELATAATVADVARQLNRHPATVWWHMVSRGLIDRRLHYRQRPYARKGRMVWPFDLAEDTALTQLREAGQLPSAIARDLNARFGRNRTAHSVRVRLHMLAAYEDVAA